MILAEHIIDIDPENKFRIYPIGDLHINLKSFQRKKFQDYLDLISQDNHCIAIGLGDMSDARPKDHKFFNPEMIAYRYKIEDLDVLEDLVSEELLEMLTPIAPSLSGLIRGNHHRPGFTKRLARDLSKIEGADVSDLGNRALIRVKLRYERTRGNQRKKETIATFVIFATHYDSGGRLPGSQVNAERQTVMSFEARVYLFAHSHRGMYAPPLKRGTIEPRGALSYHETLHFFINAGAWLDSPMIGADDYPDKYNMPVQSNEKVYLEGYISKHDSKITFKPVHYLVD